VPEELTAKFDELPAFRAAFYALTPGRQRGAAAFCGPQAVQNRNSPHRKTDATDIWRQGAARL